MSVNSRTLRPRNRSLRATRPSAPFELRTEHDVAAARQAADDAADVNWSQSVSRARTRPRSSEGSLYNLDARPSYRSTLADWSVGLGLIGGMLALVYSARSADVDGLSAIVMATLAGVLVGAGAGALVHWLFGIDRRRRSRKGQ